MTLEILLFLGVAFMLAILANRLDNRLDEIENKLDDIVTTLSELVPSRDMEYGDIK